MTTSPTYLQVGMTVLYLGKPTKVLRVSDCAAALQVERPPKDFITVDGTPVHIPNSHAIVRVSPNSRLPIVR